MPKNPIFLVLSALFLFLPAYYIFSDTYGGNAAAAVIGAVANLMHMGPLGLVLVVGGVTSTVLAFRRPDEQADAEPAGFDTEAISL